MEDKEGNGISLFLHQIIDLHRTCICTSCTLAANPHPLHHTVALDMGVRPGMYVAKVAV